MIIHVAYKTKPAGWISQVGGCWLLSVVWWFYLPIARTSPTHMPIPMGIRIDMISARWIVIAGRV